MSTDLEYKGLFVGDLKRLSNEQIAELTSQILNKRFKIFTSNEGEPRTFEVLPENEVKLLHSDFEIERYLGESILKLSGQQAGVKWLQNAVQLWYRITPKLSQEPSAFLFKHQQGYCFKRLKTELQEGKFPAWNEFLDRLSDKEFFMAFVFSIFEQANKSRQVLWLWGSGCDGKSTVMRVLGTLLGNATTSISSFNLQNNRFISSQFYGKRLCLYPDCFNSKFVTSELARNISSGDVITIDFKGKNQFSAYVYLKLIIGSNLEPSISGQTSDVSRLVPIEIKPNTNPIDEGWESKLTDELPYFLYACRQMYERLCPFNEAIKVNETTIQARQDIVDESEEMFIYLFDKYIEKTDKEEDFIPGYYIKRALEETGLLKGTDQKKFQMWLERNHGVRKEHSRDGRRYVGLKPKRTNLID